MNVEVVKREPVRALVVQHAGPMTAVQKTFEKLWQWQLEKGIAGKVKEALGICYGDPETDWKELRLTPDDSRLRYYAGVFFDEVRIAADGIVLSHLLPGGDYASYRLLGSYHQIPAAFKRLYGEWLPRSGYLPDDRPAIEIYRNNPYMTPANELITDCLIPVRK